MIRDATSSIFKDLQAAGSISNLVGRWGIGKKIVTVCQNSCWLPPRIPSCPLRALTAQTYCSFSSFLFFDPTGGIWYPTHGFVVRSDQAWNAQNPAFYLRHCALGWCQIRIQACGKTVVPVGVGEPRGNAEGVMLIGCAIFHLEITTPKRRIGFGNS